MDRGIAHQQNLRGLALGIVLLRAASNRKADTAPLIPRVNQALGTVRPGEVVEIGAE